MDYKVVYDVDLPLGTQGSHTLHGCRIFTGLREVKSGKYQELDEEVVDLLSNIFRGSLIEMGVGCEFDIYIRDITPQLCGVCGGHGYYLGERQNRVNDSTISCRSLMVNRCSCTSTVYELGDVLYAALTGKIVLREYPAAEEED